MEHLNSSNADWHYLIAFSFKLNYYVIIIALQIIIPTTCFSRGNDRNIIIDNHYWGGGGNPLFLISLTIPKITGLTGRLNGSGYPGIGTSSYGFDLLKVRTVNTSCQWSSSAADVWGCKSTSGGSIDTRERVFVLHVVCNSFNN